MTIDWANQTYAGLKVLRVWKLPKKYEGYAVELDVASNDRWLQADLDGSTVYRTPFDFITWMEEVQTLIKTQPPCWPALTSTPTTAKCECNLWSGCKCGVFKREQEAKTKK